MNRTRLLFLILCLEIVLALTLWSSPWTWTEKFQAPRTFFSILEKISFKSPDSLKHWEEKIFKGRTRYQVAGEGGRRFLKSRSQNTSSGLYLKMKAPLSPDLFLSWEWRALKFPQKQNVNQLASRSQDDFAARLYVIFPGSNIFNSRVIEYIWDERIPPGTAVSSPFSDKIKLFVIRSGLAPAKEGGWSYEERNVYEDYVRLFGRKPDRPIGAIAIMSDSDNTASASEADFGEITLKHKLNVQS